MMWLVNINLISHGQWLKVLKMARVQHDQIE